MAWMRMLLCSSVNCLFILSTSTVPLSGFQIVSELSWMASACCTGSFIRDGHCDFLCLLASLVKVKQPGLQTIHAQASKDPGCRSYSHSFLSFSSRREHILRTEGTLEAAVACGPAVLCCPIQPLCLLPTFASLLRAFLPTGVLNSIREFAPVWL